MGYQYLYLIWKILKILNFLMSTLYLMPPPLMLVNMYLIMNVTDML